LTPADTVDLVFWYKDEGNNLG